MELRRRSALALFVTPLTALSLACSGCGGDTVTNSGNDRVVSLEVTPDSMRLTIGASRKLGFVGRDQAGEPVADATPTWSSHDEAVVTVTSSGLVTGRSEGTTHVSARIGATGDSARVTVNPDDTPGQSLSLAFSTYLGGSAEDQLRDIATDAAGNIYVTGGTASSDFPVTAGAFDPTFNSTREGDHDVFVTKLDRNGTILWSTFIGGPGYDRAYGIEVDDQGFIYVAGRAGDGFPVTSGAFQTGFQGGRGAAVYGPQDGFVCKLRPDGSDLVFCSYFGTSDPQIVRDLAVNGSGDVYLAASRVSGSFPQSWFDGSFQPDPVGGRDGVVAKVASDGSSVLWASYLGGSGDESAQPSIRVGPDGGAYVALATTSTDLPAPGGFDPSYNGDGDMYVARFSADGSDLVFGTYLGGSGKEFTETHELGIDLQGNVFVATTTLSTDFPVTSEAVQPFYGGSGGDGTGGGTNYPGDTFVSKISADGAQLIASTYLGGRFGEGGEGIGIDQNGNVYASGASYSPDFPTTPGAFRSSGAGDADFFGARLAPDLSNLLYATYIGGSDTDWARTSTATASGDFLIGGMSRSADWPTMNAAQAVHRGDFDGVLALFVPVTP